MGELLVDLNAHLVNQDIGYFELHSLVDRPPALCSLVLSEGVPVVALELMVAVVSGSQATSSS